MGNDDTFAERLRLAMRKRTVREVSDAADISESTIHNWLYGNRTSPRGEQLAAVARALGVSADYLLGIAGDDADWRKPNLSVERDFALLPLLGSVTAGEGGIAEEHVLGYHHVPKTFIPDGQEQNCFLLQAHGDSMDDAGITDGTLMVICSTVSVRDGDIAVLDLDGEAVVKRVYHQDTETLMLISESSDPRHTPRIATRAQIVGRVMASFRVH